MKGATVSSTNVTLSRSSETITLIFTRLSSTCLQRYKSLSNRAFLTMIGKYQSSDHSKKHSLELSDHSTVTLQADFLFIIIRSSFS